MPAPVYDDQKTSQDDDEINKLRDITGIGKDEEQAMDDRARTDDMAEREGLSELDGDGGKNKQSDKSDGKKPDSDDEKDFAPNIGEGKGGKGGGLRAKFFNRKTAIGGGLVGLLAGGGFGLLTIVSGPAQIVQFAQFLDNIHFNRNTNASENRLGKMFEYFRTSGPEGDKSRRNVGYTMEKITDHYMKGLVRDGIEMDFTNPDGSRNRRMQRINIDTNQPGGESALGRMRQQGYELTELGDGRYSLDFDRGGNSGLRRDALKIAADTGNKGRVHSKVSNRLLIHRAGVDMNWFRNARLRAGEKLSDWRNDRKKERAERVRHGKENLASGSDVEGQKDEVQNEDGTTTEVDVPENEELAGDGNGGIDAAKSDGLDPNKRLNLAKQFMRGGAVATAAIGVLCAVRGVGNGIDTFLHEQVNLVMIRQAIMIMSMGSQIQSGVAVNMEEVGAVAADFYDEETNTSVTAAPAALAAQDRPFNNANDVKVKPGKSKPQLFKIIDQIPLLGTACAIQEGFFGIIRRVPVIGQGLQLAEQGTEAAIDSVLGRFGLSSEELMEKAISVMAGDVVDLFATGAQLGGNAMIGALLAANDAALATGGFLMDMVSVKELDSRLAMERMDSFKQKSFGDRLFDVYNPDSFVAKAVMQNNNFASLSNMARSFSTMPANIFGMFGSAFSSMMPSASAAGTFDYNYFGSEDDQEENQVYAWSEADLNRYPDPYQNMDWMQANDGEMLKKANTDYGVCFATTINPASGAVVAGETPTRETLESERCTEDKGDELFERYRTYLLDVAGVVAPAACLEGIDEQYCSELGVGQSPSEAVSSSIGGATFPCQGQKRAVSKKGSYDAADWSGVTPTGTAGQHADGTPINVYVREACDTANVKTVVIVGSIHGSENGGQLVAWDMLFNASLPNNVRIVAIPEYCACAGTGIRGDGANVDPDNNHLIDLNRNFNYNWSSLPRTQRFSSGNTYSKGPAVESEPETQGVIAFLRNLGKIDLFVVYHDALGYVAAAGDTPVTYAQIYSQHTPDTPLRATEGGKVYQSGSIDGWVNQDLRAPSLLVEMTNNQSQQIVDGHVAGLSAAAEAIP